jgi:hypothetical protein
MVDQSRLVTLNMMGNTYNTGGAYSVINTIRKSTNYGLTVVTSPQPIVYR